jgi:broad specificity phosphatase PhoE
MPTLYLVRHGEPSLRGLVLGRMDPGLSPAGHEAARAALGELRGAIACVSPLRRALQTASCLPPDIPRRVLPELAEVGQGEWEGLSWQQIEARDPELARRRLERWLEVTPPGGEPWPEALARADAALALLRGGPLPAIVVAHAGINSALAHLLTGVDARAVRQAYCEVLTYEL